MGGNHDQTSALVLDVTELRGHKARARVLHDVLGRRTRSGRSREGCGMHGEQDGAKISQAYQDHRPYLLDLAFRMLGDIGAAQDIVQDAFTRLMAAKLSEIEDERGWLIVVTSRLCLDQIKSARSRRERAHDSSEIEWAAARQPAASSPAGPGRR